MHWQVTLYSYLLLVAAAMSATLVLDARMPEMDGLTATRKIKKEMPAISVLVVSAYESEDYRREAASAGATDYISKDAERRQLLEVVHAGLGQRGKDRPPVSSVHLHKVTAEVFHVLEGTFGFQLVIPQVSG